MKNNNLVFWVLVLGCLAAGFISGWTIKECVSDGKGFVDRSGGVVKTHDTIKTGVVEYRIIPGTAYNVDSIVDAVNRAWKDSLKSLYGKGLFESKFTKEDNLGKREITLESRIPVDPKAEVTLTEELKLPEVYPVRRFGLFGCAAYGSKPGFEGSVGVRYYVMDFKNFSVSGSAEGKYEVNNLSWHAEVRL